MWCSIGIVLKNCFLIWYQSLTSFVGALHVYFRLILTACSKKKVRCCISARDRTGDLLWCDPFTGAQVSELSSSSHLLFWAGKLGVLKAHQTSRVQIQTLGFDLIYHSDILMEYTITPAFWEVISFFFLIAHHIIIKHL